MAPTLENVDVRVCACSSAGLDFKITNLIQILEYFKGIRYANTRVGNWGIRQSR